MEWGIGAKTALNYGRFSQFEDRTDLLHEIRQKKIERRIREAEERDKAAEAQRIAEMSEEERIAYQISKLDPNNEEEKNRSKGDLYAAVLRINSAKAASALKEYWQKSGDWSGSISKKQKEKVAKITEIIQRG